MYTVTVVLFLLPFSLLWIAWRRSDRNERETNPPNWRVYFNKAALSVATFSTLLEMAFFFSWFHNGGSPHGMTPPPGLWKALGPVAIWSLVASVILGAFGKGKWRLMFLAWVVAYGFVMYAIFMLEMD